MKSSIVDAPKVSSEVSMRFGMGFIAPLGRVLSFRYMFNGAVNMWRSIVVGRMIKNAQNVSTCATHMAWCQPARFDEPSTRPDSG